MKIGFIGGGAMAQAIISGITSKLVDPSNIYVSDHKQSRCDELKEKYGIHSYVGAEKFCSDCDILILAIKPQVAKEAFLEVKPLLNKKTIVVSIIAGITLNTLQSYFENNSIIRVMPNTPMAVGAGMSALSLGEKATQAQGEQIKDLFASCGKAIIVPEKLIDAVSGLSGSGPAFIFMIIDALCDAGVLAGLKKSDALLLATQTVYGSAKMVLDTNLHPAQLKDQVTSPGGTTIEGIRVLENHCLRGALIEGVSAAINKSKLMGGKPVAKNI